MKSYEIYSNEIGEYGRIPDEFTEALQPSEETSEPNIPLQTSIIKSKKKFEALFDGFSKLRAISYVVTPDRLLDLFDKGFETVEIVVGDSLTNSYKHELSKEKKPIEVTKQLAELVEGDRLRVFSSKRPIHTKLYILENNQIIRVMLSSANLTETAWKAHQINYCWYLDFPSYSRSKELKQIIKDYEAHKEGCTLFMDDLVNLKRQSNGEDRDNVYEIWLQTPVKSEVAEARKIVSTVTEQALGLDETGESDSIISISLDSSSGKRAVIKKFLRPFNVQETDKGLSLKRATYLDHEIHGIPLMKVSLEKERVVLGLGGERLIRTDELLPDGATIYKSLEHLEDYIKTVDLGTAANPPATKMSVYEALLYLLAAPFFNEYMKIKRKKVGMVNTRGPRFLYIYGPSHNGKTTFLRFALQLLTGKLIEPTPGDKLTKARIENVTTKGTSFPLIFDDVPMKKWREQEVIFKSYWETEWEGKATFPQIILSSNKPDLPDWAQTRIRKVEFDVHFDDNAENQEILHRIFSVDNQIFKWFSHVYIKYLKEYEKYEEDELYIARKVMKELYDLAGRQIPEFFPMLPVEKLYDPGRKEWQALLYRHHQAEIEDEKDVLYIKFTDDMENYDVKPYLSYLPQNIKCNKKGKQIIIENPEQFYQWLNATDLKPAEDLTSPSLLTKLRHYIFSSLVRNK